MRKIIVNTLLIVLILSGLLSSGCRSKKKVSSISRGYDIEYEEVKNDTKAEENKVTNEATKENEKTKETFDRNVIERFIFGDDGRIQEYNKTTNEKGQKDTDRNKETNKADSTATNTASSTTDITGNASGKEDIAATEEPPAPKKRNPIWNWIGGALFLVIVGYAVWKVVLKR